MRREIAEARNAFIRTYDGMAPNMLVISPPAWQQLCGEMDPKSVLMDCAVWKKTAPVMGMQTYISDDVEGFVVGMSLGARS